MSDRDSIVDMKAVRKSFEGVEVLHSVDFHVAKGEVRAIVGQNGAGKSTLIKVLGGVYSDYQGDVVIDGNSVRVTTPRTAAENGIAVIYQELSLIPEMTVCENIALGREPGRFGYRAADVRSLAEEAVSSVPMLAELPLDAEVSTLNPGFKQRVEIAKALSRNAKVLVLDEPTARLSGPERDDLKALIQQLSESGLAIIFISHFLEEILGMCSSVTVMRNGRIVEEGPIENYTLASITRAMLGMELSSGASGSGRDLSGSVFLELEGFRAGTKPPVDLMVRTGEILGFAGLVGSGRSHLLRSIAGSDPVGGGTMRLDGRETVFGSPRAALKAGVVMLPEDRKADGIFAVLSAGHNVVTMGLDRGLARFGWLLDFGPLRSTVASSMGQFEVSPADSDLAIGKFSGGNQQKLLFGRAIAARPRLLIVDQPTAGVDIGTKEQIHQALRNIAKSGTTVLIASDDLDELISVCDSVALMDRGVLARKVATEGMSRESLVDAISQLGNSAA